DRRFDDRQVHIFAGWLQHWSLAAGLGRCGRGRRDRRRMKRRGWSGGDGPRPLCRRVLAQANRLALALQLELDEVVLAHEFETLFDFVYGHQSGIRAYDTDVRTSPPRSVTSTSSSIRTPPHPGRYAPGSIVKTIPGSSSTGAASAGGRVTRGSSCTSRPRPWPVPWPNASPSPCRSRTRRA